MKRALDLFCGAGGATKGLQRAGFHVTGVDIKPQPHYCGDNFIQGDALWIRLVDYDFVWASPPCQHFSALNNRFGLDPKRSPDCIGFLRGMLNRSGLFYVIENVVGAPLINPIMLCGTMFNLRLDEHRYLQRHRLFESNLHLFAPKCCHPKHGRAVSVAGHGSTDGVKGGMKLCADDARTIMGVPWMNRDEAAQAIPPAYSEYIGNQVIKVLT